MNDIDTLMSRIDTINAIPNPRDLTDSDIDTLIAYYRRQRARRAAGEKPDRTKPAIDMSALLNLPTTKALPNASTITRRI